MMPEINHFVGGALLGAGSAWLLELRVSAFLREADTENPETSRKHRPRRGLLIVMSLVGTAALAGWRQWTPELLSDLILVMPLLGIALIDWKTLLIDGRLVALAMGLRLVWLSYFAPAEILNALTGMLIGAGFLYLIGFLYEVFRHRQGLGEGDAAVLGLIGMWVGWQGLGAVLLIAALSGMIIGGIALFRQRQAHQNFSTLLQTQIPFAPFLCLGGILVHFFRQIGFIAFIF